VKRPAGPVADAEIRNAFAGIAGTVVQAGIIGEYHQHLSVVLPDRPPTVPRRLPPAPARLINRDAELARLDALLVEADGAPGPLVAVLSGMHGVGKSAVASHWANIARKRFDGGDLFGDFSTRRSQRVVQTSDVLGEFIRQLGTESIAIPPTLRERTGMFRDLTAGRRLLVLLDDVGDAAQVTPLLPTGPGSVVVVTSNSHLAELLYERARLVCVDPLEDTTARRLLVDMAGAERIRAEPEATAELVSICGGLPITLCVMGATLMRFPHRGIATTVMEISDEACRLRGLSGKGSLSIQDVFDFAYSNLDESEALLYRSVGVHPGREFAVAHAAALADVPVSDAAERLSVLADLHLVETVPGDRYRLHDLVRLHACECATRHSDGAVEASIRRLVDWYYMALRRADRSLTIERLRFAEEESRELPGLPRFANRHDVFTWFDIERNGIMAALRAATEREWDDRIWQMSEALWLFFYNRKPFTDWIEACEAGIESARRGREPAAEGRMHAQLARAYLDLREYGAADRELSAAEEAADRSGNERLRASVGEFRGAYYLNQGSYDRAIMEFELARSVGERCGRARDVAIQDYHIGAALTQKGRPRKAVVSLRRAVAVMRGLDDEINVARTLLHLGRAQRAARYRHQAYASLQEAAGVAERLGIRHTEAEAHEELAELADAARHVAQAAEHRLAAYAAYRDIGHPRAAELADAIAIVPRESQVHR